MRRSLGAGRRVRGIALLLAREAAIADKMMTVKPEKQMSQKLVNPHSQPPPLIPDSQRGMLLYILNAQINITTECERLFQKPKWNGIANPNSSV